MCITSSHEEYLQIHKFLEEAGVPLYRSYRDRVTMGLDIYQSYPNLYWDRDSGISGTFANDSRNGKYNVLTTDEFLIKAGVKFPNKVFNNGYGLIHRFV